MTFKQFLSLSLSIMVVLCSPLVAQASDSSSATVSLHRSEIISLDKTVSKFIIGNNEVVDVVRHGDKKLSIQGLKVGTTTIRTLDKSGNLLSLVNVTVVPDLPSVRQSLKSLLPHENIGVEIIGNNIALTGIVSDAEAAARAVMIANEFVKVQNYGRDVVNLMQVASGQQVMLRVRVGEIQRTALKKIGVSLQGLRATSKLKIPFATGNEVGTSINTLGSAVDSFATGGIMYSGSGVDLSASLDLLEKDGMFKVLAEPNLVAVSGKSADFLAGGEFPVPVSQGEERMSVEYKKFGVSVSFTPLVLSQNRIRLSVAPEVSEISTDQASGAISTKELSVPSVTTRRANTTVELSPGESFMVAGLIKDQFSTEIQQTPGISNIPILGAALRHTATSRNETELVIAVTPYLVNPLTGSDVRLPTDYFRPATMLETMFFGALGTTAKQGGNPASLEGPFGFMMD
ncbi:MAG: type II and III secretion system protein family protein [Alphaproteobacteria bacterium]|nr:type II and III secretion system protein family protein [Alphaproteobacteria bacterium]